MTTQFVAAKKARNMEYANKVIMAPMVRIGTLPSRLLALKYGADIVYSEETIDHSILKCRRFHNRLIGTVDFIEEGGRSIFRTCPLERRKIIFQMGTSDPARALEAAKLVKDDVAGIDINMGCPKGFSLKGGMGAALLEKPEKVREILTTLVQGLDIPVTCKIRILPSVEKTLELVKVIESTGVAALAVHGRTKEERSSSPVHIDVLRQIASIATVPIIANGGSDLIKSREDAAAFISNTNCSSVMIARAAQWNPSIFRSSGPLPTEEVVKEYLKLAIEYNNPFANTKYCLAQIMHDRLTSPNGAKLTAARSMEELCNVWGMISYYEEIMAKRRELYENLSIREQKELSFITDRLFPSKKSKMDPEVTEDGTLELFIRYESKDYINVPTPKVYLNDWTTRERLPIKYNTVQRSKDQLFKSTLTIKDTRYSSSLWAKSKRNAEQSAAMVALEIIGIKTPQSTASNS